jgi:hypothetical protein
MNREGRACLTFSFAIAFALFIAAPTNAKPASSPRAYCAKVVNDDQLRSPPPSLAAAINQLFEVSGTFGLQTTNYRCAAGKVMLCNEGANLPCGKANLSKILPGAAAWCKDNPNTNFIPMVATGHDTLYRWRCVKGVATPGAPLSDVDPRGFFADDWKALP